MMPLTASLIYNNMVREEVGTGGQPCYIDIGKIPYLDKGIRSALPFEMAASLNRIDEQCAAMLREGKQPGEDAVLMGEYDRIMADPAFHEIDERMADTIWGINFVADGP